MYRRIAPVPIYGINCTTMSKNKMQINIEKVIKKTLQSILSIKTALNIQLFAQIIN